MENGFFGKMFDLDNSGHLDMGEQFLDFMAFSELTKEDTEQLFEDEDDDEEDSWQTRSSSFQMRKEIDGANNCKK